MDLPSYGFDVQERSASAAGGRRELPKDALRAMGTPARRSGESILTAQLVDGLIQVCRKL